VANEASFGVSVKGIKTNPFKPMARARHIIVFLLLWRGCRSFAKSQKCQKYALFSHCFVELNKNAVPVALIMGSSMPWCMLLCRVLAIMAVKVNRARVGVCTRLV
jgi:hypothetical protein